MHAELQNKIVVKTTLGHIYGRIDHISELFWLIFRLTYIFIIFTSLMSCSLTPLTNNKYSTTTVSLYSNIVGQNYTLYIMLPQNYGQSNQTYPVLYCLDGDSDSYDIFNEACLLENLNIIQPLIVVAIGYGNVITEGILRERDYTPTSWSAITLTTGGANKFFQFIAQELIPYIDKTYQTISTAEARYLFGNSLGGLASAHGFLDYSDSIRNFIMDNPAVMWDEGVIFNDESQFYATTAKTASFTTNHYQIIITAGILNDTGWIAQIESYCNVFQSRNYSNCSIYFSLLANVSDDDSVPNAIGFALPKMLAR